MTAHGASEHRSRCLPIRKATSVPLLVSFFDGLAHSDQVAVVEHGVLAAVVPLKAVLLGQVGREVQSNQREMALDIIIHGVTAVGQRR